MAAPSNRPGEEPSTYFFQDRANRDELTRLHTQDWYMTATLGTLPEQADLSLFTQILDVGCGTGEWLLETARQAPQNSHLVGIDVSRHVIAFAQAQASARQLGERVHFQVMDALRQMAFADQIFDLVNQRSGAGYLRTWDWPHLLQNYQHVCKPGGLIRITEGEWTIESTSAALTQLFEGLLTAFYQAGYSFTPTSDGVTAHLVPLLERMGFQQIQTRRHLLEHRAGTANWQEFCDNMRLLFRTTLAFQQKWSRVPEHYDALYEQMLRDLAQPGFVAQARLLTVWGVNPSGPAVLVPRPQEP